MAQNVSEELARLAELRDKGVLTPEEFEAQKARVLAGEPATATSAQIAEPKKKSKAGMGCLAVVAIVVILIIIGAIAGSPNGTAAGKGNATADAAPARAVTARELARAYSANEVAAQKEYGDQALSVTGTVSGISLDFMNNPTLQFETENQFLPAQASFDKSYGSKLAAISKGSKVTITCKSITEVVSAPMLDDCSL